MCTKLKGYMSLVREYTREIFTYGGLVAAIWVYTDFKAFLSEQSRVLAELSVRIEHIEHKLEK